MGVDEIPLAKTVCFQILAYSNDAEKEKEMKENVLKFYPAQEQLLNQQYDETRRSSTQLLNHSTRELAR
jgi:hypothetical protein